jgi:hypothetical protein
MKMPTAAADRKMSPTCDVMYGRMMDSPEELPTPTRTTVGPITLRSFGALGMSRYSGGAGGRCAPPVRRQDRSFMR